jgi:hypothetical protein
VHDLYGKFLEKVALVHLLVAYVHSWVPNMRLFYENFLPKYALMQLFIPHVGKGVDFELHVFEPGLSGKKGFGLFGLRVPKFYRFMKGIRDGGIKLIRFFPFFYLEKIKVFVF